MTSECRPHMVWLDLDDTLWDFRANSLVALRDMYRHKELNRFWEEAEQWLDAYHTVNDELWALYAPGKITRDYLRMERFRRPLAEAGCPDGEARRLSEELDPLYLGRLAEMAGTVPGALPLLERIRACGMRTGILSNGFAEVQYGKMRTSGIDRFIDVTVLSDEIDVNKPDERIFRHAERKAGVTARECTLIGDNVDTDIAGALNAGWDAVWFNPRGLPVPPSMSANPHLRVVSSLDEILDRAGLCKLV